MAVVSVDEMLGRQSAITDTFERDYTRVFRVVTNNRLDSELTIILHPALPKPSDIYVTSDGLIDTGSRCQKVMAKQTNIMAFGGMWEVTAEYSSKGIAPDRNNKNPILRPADIKWTMQQYNKQVNADIDGEPFLNTAGQPFREGLEKEDARPVVTVTKNLIAFDIDAAIFYSNKVNEKRWFGVDAGVAKMQGIEGDLSFENGFDFWKVKYEIHFRLEGWGKKILNAGSVRKVGGKKKNIHDGDGSKMTEVVLLDQNGDLLPDGQQPIFLTFDIYDSVDFNLLTIP